MSPRAMLTLLVAAYAVLSAGAPARADADAPAGPALRYSTPHAGAAPAERPRGEAAPQERPAPPQVPNGCPYRDGKLELIV